MAIGSPVRSIRCVIAQLALDLPTSVQLDLAAMAPHGVPDFLASHPKLYRLLKDLFARHLSPDGSSLVVHNERQDVLATMLIDTNQITRRSENLMKRDYTTYASPSGYSRSGRWWSQACMPVRMLRSLFCPTRTY